jgi:hypothetical protein
MIKNTRLSCLVISAMVYNTQGFAFLKNPQRSSFGLRSGGLAGDASKETISIDNCSLYGGDSRYESFD